MRFVAVCHTRPIVCDVHHDERTLATCADGDSRVLGRVFEGVHDEIRKHLHDEMDVDAYQQDVVSVLDGDGTSMRCLGDMAEGGLDDLVDELGC